MPAPKDPEAYALWKKRIGEASKGRKLTPEQKARQGAAISKAKTGKPRPDMRGENNPMNRPDVAEKVARAHRGVPKSDDQRAKIRATLRDRHTIVSYIAAHKRLRIDRGSASNYPCLTCDLPAVDWAYRVRSRGPKAYSMNPSDYVPLCKSCHAAFDHGSIDLP